MGYSNGPVENCHSTGAVWGKVVYNCVALNQDLTTTVSFPVFGRVIGGKYSVPAVSNSYARKDISKNGSVHTWLNTGGNNNDGEDIDITSGEFNDIGWWKDIALFPENEWVFAASKLPTLKNTGGLQNPAVK